MAEAFGIAAGAFGVVSLSVQLAESVQKVKGFYENVKNAPPRLANLIEEIEGVSDCVKELEHEYQSTGLVASASLQRCIKSSREAVDYFETFAVGLQNRTKKSRITGGLRFALSQDDIERMLGKLERSKSLLTMAYTQFRQIIQQQQLDAIRQSIEGLSSGQTVILKAVQADASEVVEAKAISNRRFYRQDYVHSKQVFEAKTPAWMSHRIWQLAMHKSISGWQFTLRTYGIVSSDSEVFKACDDGDLVGMRKLFDAGLASPFDHDGQGLSLFFVTLGQKNVDVIRFLLQFGASHIIGEQPSAIFWRIALTRPSMSLDKIREGISYLDENFEDEERTPSSWMDGARHLISCSSERAPSLLIWQRVLHWRPSNGQFPMRTSNFTGNSCLLAQYEPDDLMGLTRLQLYAVYYGRYVGLTFGQRSDVHNERFEESLFAAIDLGFDIHKGSDGHTPLMQYLASFLEEIWRLQATFGVRIRTSKGLKEALSRWLVLLQRAGMDLLAYGKEERRLFEVYQSLPDPVPLLQKWTDAYWDEQSIIPPFSLTNGSTPSEWDIELLHLVEERAGGFWRMVEMQTEELNVIGMRYRVVGSMTDGVGTESECLITHIGALKRSIGSVGSDTFAPLYIRQAQGERRDFLGRVGLRESVAHLIGLA